MMVATYAKLHKDNPSICLTLAPMDRSKIVAIVTGVISLVLAIAYLLVVQFIDFRGEMLPAPIVDTILLGLNL